MNIVTDVSQSADFLSNAWRGICINIDIVLAKLLSYLYSLFYYTATAEFRDNELFNQIIENVGKIIGIIVLFSVAISFIQYVVNPDKFSDLKVGAGKLVTKILISLTLLTSVNYIFDMAFKLEELIISNNVIEKILLPRDDGSYTGSSTIVGNTLAADVLFTFIVDNDMADTISLPGTVYPASELKRNMREGATIEQGNSWLSVLQRDINIINNSNKEYYYKYTTILPTVVMIFFGIIFISYTFSVGVRVIQLFYLQIIAPLPIMMYILPNGDDKLKNWVKQCTTTYFDLFIRFFIINFALVLIKNLFEPGKVVLEISTETELRSFVIIAIMLAILMFAKKAPDLIKELFPGKSAASGDFGISLKNRFKDNAAGAVVGGVAGGLAGMATGAIANKGFFGKIGGALGGLGRGTLGGLTGKKTADTIKRTAEIGTLQRSGVGAFERATRNIGERFGAETPLQKNSRLRQKNEVRIANNDAKIKSVEDIKTRAVSQAYKNNVSATIKKGSITDAYGHDDEIKFTSINRVKDSIERARSTGSKFFEIDGREYHTSDADNFIKQAEKVASMEVINSGSDTIINNMIRGYEPGFLGDAEHLYKSADDAKEDTSYIKSTDEYRELQAEKERLEQEKARRG